MANIADMFCAGRGSKADDAAPEQLAAALADAQKKVLELELARQRIKSLEDERASMLKSLEDERASMRQQMEKQSQQLEVQAKEAAALRSRLETVEGERDAARRDVQESQGAVTQLEVAQKQVGELQEGQNKLQKELAATKLERRKSLSEVTRSLSEISDKLDSAKTSWTPWQEINGAKEHVAHIQETVGQQDQRSEGARA